MRFTIDYTATTLLILGLILIYILQSVLISRSTRPSFAFSKVANIKQTTWRSRLAELPNKLHAGALACLMIAFVDPHFLLNRSTAQSPQSSSSHLLPTEGIAIYLILDQSGSMAESVKSADGKGQIQSLPKIDLLKNVTREFILNHPSDLIGLVSFARVPRILVPLTLDQQTLLKTLNQIQITNNSSEDGTAIGYAIYKTANLLAATRHFANDVKEQGRPPYTIKNAVMIVVTDGFQDPSRLDQGNRLRTLELDDAAAFAKEQNIRLYIINIDPALSTSEYAPQRRQLQKITALTGGKFYMVNDSQALSDIYSDINKLEKGTILHPISDDLRDNSSNDKRFSLYPFFLSLGMFCLFLSLFLESTFVRRVP